MAENGNKNESSFKFFRQRRTWSLHVVVLEDSCAIMVCLCFLLVSLLTTILIVKCVKRVTSTFSSCPSQALRSPYLLNYYIFFAMSTRLSLCLYPRGWQTWIFCTNFINWNTKRLMQCFNLLSWYSSTHEGNFINFLCTKHKEKDEVIEKNFQ